MYDRGLKFITAAPFSIWTGIRNNNRWIRGLLPLHLPTDPEILSIRFSAWSSKADCLTSLAKRVKDMFFHDAADVRLLDTQEEVSPSLESDQLCAGNG